MYYETIEIQQKEENLKYFLGAKVWAPKPAYWSQYVTVTFQVFLFEDSFSTVQFKIECF